MLCLGPLAQNLRCCNPVDFKPVDLAQLFFDERTKLLTDISNEDSGGKLPSAPQIKSAAQIKIGAEPVQPVEAPKGELALSAVEPVRLDPGLFPNKGKPGRPPPTTIANLAYLLEQHGIAARYNVIKKKSEFTLPGVAMTPDNMDNVARAHVVSLAAYNGMNTGLVEGFLEAVADMNAYNPVADWINSKPWDQIDRLPDFYATLTTKPDFPIGLKEVLMGKWLLSCTAAALSQNGFKCRGVLTLQGEQGIGKTSWGRRLVSDPLLRDEVIKTDHHLDPSNKDSLITAVGHWLCEIGEVESSLKREMSRLKGFLTAETDKVRRPYGRADSEYQRRTVFYATVNQADFLLDNTGNGRWWIMSVEKIDYQHDIDMQQLFAQLAEQYRAGEPWWLTRDEEAELERQNSKHMTVSVVRDAVLAIIDLDRDPAPSDSAFTATELLQLAGIKFPTNPQSKECGAILRQIFGDPKRINGRDKWRVPLGDQDGDDEPSVEDHKSEKKFD